MITRRQLLQMGGAAAAVATAAAHSARAQGLKSGMGIGNSSYSLRSLADRRSGAKEPFTEPLSLLEHCREIGAGGIQASLRSTERGYVNQVRKLAEKYGMYVEVNVRLPREQTDLDDFKRTVQSAKDAGALALRAVTLGERRYETFDTADAFLQFAQQAWKSLVLAEPVVRRQRMKLAVENHKDWRVDEMVALLKKLSSESVGVTLDTGNNIALLDDPMKTVEALAPYAYSVHLKDMGVEEYEKGFLLSEVPFGDGFLDLKKIVQTVQRSQPNTRFTLEMITRDPLEIPVLTEKYWPTFAALPGRDLAMMLVTVKNNKPAKPLPRISHLSPEEQLKTEEENVRKCIAYAAEVLGI
jgi:sugar phosphate isomerase/epimerase